MVFLSYEKGVTGHPANKDVVLRVMSMDNKEVNALVDIVGGAGTINVPSWALDSRHLAFVSYQMLPPDYDGKRQYGYPSTRFSSPNLGGEKRTFYDKGTDLNFVFP